MALEDGLGLGEGTMGEKMRPKFPEALSLGAFDSGSLKMHSSYESCADPIPK